MTPPPSPEPCPEVAREAAARPPSPRRKREETVARLSDFEKREATVSQRQWAEEAGVARSTLQYWHARKKGLASSPGLIGFFESPDGLAFLHRLVLVLLLVFKAEGLRRVALALRMAGLSPFVGTSVGNLHKASVALEKQIIAFEELQKADLAAKMEPQKITVVEDENFHEKLICLVAIEPVSNFILLEKYSEKRDAASWDAALNQALHGLKVKVIQSTSDEGKGLLGHVENGLEAHHSPDLFHCQHDLSRGTSLALAKEVHRAEEAIAKVTQLKEVTLPKNEAEWREHSPTGKIPDFAPHFEKAEADLAKATAQRQTAQDRQTRAKEAIRGLGDDYHPINLQTGELVKPEEIQSKLKARFDAIDAVAKEAALPQRCLDAIAKAKRLLPLLVGTVLFFWTHVAALLNGLGLSPDQMRAAQEYLLPLAYLESALRKARDKASRQKLRELMEKMCATPPAFAAALASLPPDERAALDKVVRQCANLFQRASSCVEGRNGQLSFHHHGLHALSERKLHVLTILHNYFIRRPDGTTAAQRFFGSPHPDLLEWLLDRVDVPTRPRSRRKAPKPA